MFYLRPCEDIPPYMVRFCSDWARSEDDAKILPIPGDIH